MKSKHAALGLAIILICFLLTACDPPNFYHKKYAGEVHGIELIEYDLKDIQSGKDIQKFDFEKVKIIQALNVNKQDDFLSDLAEWFIVAYRTHPCSVNGICIRICFGDKTFEVISENRLIVRYTEMGDVLEYIGIVDDKSKFTDIINKYFTIQEGANGFINSFSFYDYKEIV